MITIINFFIGIVDKLFTISYENNFIYQFTKYTFIAIPSKEIFILKNTNTYSNNYIISEVKKIKDLIYKAYYVENEVKKEEENDTFLKKLFGFK